MYEFALNHNNIAGLIVVSIQPSSPGIPVNLFMDGNGRSVIKGRRKTEWAYDPALPADDFETLLAEFGLDYNDSPSVACTIMTTINESATGYTRDFAPFNAWITVPPSPKFKYFWQPIVFTLTALEQLS